MKWMMLSLAILATVFVATQANSEVVFSVPQAFAGNGSAELKFTNPAANNEVQLLVTMNYPEQLNTWILGIKYDPEKCEFVEAQPADEKFFGAMAKAQFERTEIGLFGKMSVGQKVFICESLSREHGIVKIAGSTFGQANAFSGSTSVSVRFRKKGSDTGTFSVQQLSYLNPSGQEVNIDTVLPQAYKGLDVSNQPNPFNPSTQIKFSLPDGENVKVEVYNPLGQLVRTLVNGYKTGGQHSVLWDGADETGQKMASGVYLCKVTAGKQEMLRRMLLLK